jgi:autotransporter-associated beta strand protein
MNQKPIPFLLALFLIGMAWFAPALQASVRMSSGVNPFATRATFGTSTGWALPAGDWTLGIWDNNFQGDGGVLIAGPIDLAYVPVGKDFPGQGRFMVGGKDSAGNLFGSGGKIMQDVIEGTLPVGYPGRVTGKFTPRLHIIRRNAGKSEYLVAEAGHAPVLVCSETRPFVGTTGVSGWALACINSYGDLYDADLEGLFFATASVSDRDIGLMAAGHKPSSVASLNGNLQVYFPLETAVLSNTSSSVTLVNQGSDSTVGLKRLGPVSSFADGPMLRGATAENNTPAQVTEPTNVVALDSLQPFQIIRHLNGSANVAFTGFDYGTGTADIGIRFIDVEHATSTPWQTLATGSAGGGAAIQSTIPVPKGYWKTIEVRRLNSTGGTGDSSRPNRTWSRWAVGEVVVVWGDSIQGQVQSTGRANIVAPNGFTAKYPTTYPNTIAGDTNPLSNGMWNFLRGGGMGGGTQGENEIANNLSEASRCCVGITVSWAGATRLAYWNGRLGSTSYNTSKAYCMANGGLNKPNVITWVGNLASANSFDDFYDDLNRFKTALDTDFGAGTWKLILAPVPIVYGGSGNAGGLHILRDACWRWVRDNPAIGQYGGVFIDHETYDGVHPTGAAWDIMGPRWGNAAGFLRDPQNCADPRAGEIVRFYRSAGKLTVEVQLYAGTALSLKNPAASISGLKLSSDNFATTIPITSAVLTGGTTFEITPASLPAGPLKLRYAYGMPGASGSTLAAQGADNLLYVNAGPTNIMAVQPIWGTAANDWSLAEDMNATPPPSITTLTLPGGNVGDVYSQTLAATGGVPPYTWSLASGTLPPGLTLGSNGAISGTPSSSGTSNFTVRVTGNDNAFSTASFSLTVSNTHAPSIETSALPEGNIGDVYSQTLSATGGTAPYAWSLVSGALPPGLTLGSGGVISGTPSVSGTSNFIIGVAGSDNASSTASFSLVITIDPPPSITTASLPAGKVGEAYHQALAATGGASPYTWSLVAGTLPAGLTLGSDGVISGSPTASGTSNFTIGVAGGDNASSSANFSLSVSNNSGTGSLYWDGNDALAGAGNTTALLNRAWGADAAWNSDATGGTSGFTAATGVGDDLFFVAAPSVTSGQIAFNPTVTGTQSANSITFQSQGAQTLSGGTINLGSGGLAGSQYAYGTINRGTVTISSALALQAAQNWGNHATTAMTVSGAISGTADLTVQNSPASGLTLSGGNSAYSGTTTLAAGALTATGAASNTFATLGTGGLILNGGTFNLRSNGAANGGANIITGNGTTGNNLTTGSAEVTINVNNNGANTSNSFTFNNLSVGTGKLNVSGGNQYNLRFAGTTTLTSNATLNVTTSTLGLVGAIGESGGSFGLTKLGAAATGVSVATGSLTMTGASTYTGVTSVLEGILTLNGNAPSGAAGTLGNASSAVLLGNTSGNVNAALMSNNYTVARDITVQSGNTGTVHLGSGSNSGSNTYSGTITLGSAGSAGHDLTLASAGTHQMVVSGLVRDSPALSGSPGVLTIGDVTVANALTGSFSPNPTNGSSIYLMTGANTYSGGTVIHTSGAVRIGHANAFGTGNLSIVRGTIQGNGTSVLAGISGMTWDGNFSLNSFASGGQGAVNLGTVPVLLTGDRIISVSNNTTTVGGTILGPERRLQVNGGSTTAGLALNGASTFDGGLLVVGSNAAALTVSSGNASAFGTGQLSFNNTSNARASLSVDTTVESLSSPGLIATPSFTAGTGGTNGTQALVFTGGGGSGAAGSATIAGGGVTSITITSWGTGYTSAPAIALGSPGVSTATFTSAYGAGSMILNARVLTLSGGNASPATYTGIISGTNGSLVKDGTGTQILAGASTYTGATDINAGSLVVSGSLASGSTVGVGASGTLGGTGTVAGTVNAAGTIAPGAGAGTLTTGSATLSGTLAIEIDGATGDKLLSTGELNITGAHLTVSLLAGGFSQASYVIAEGSSLTGTFASVPSGYHVSYSTTQATLTQTGGTAHFASWAAANGIPSQPADGDFDKDGLTNLVEYALGKDPAVTNPFPGTLSGNVLTFTKGSDAVANGDVNFMIEESGDLVSWSAVVTQNAPDASPSISYTLPTGRSKEFVRLKVTQTP